MMDIENDTPEGAEFDNPPSLQLDGPQSSHLSLKSTKSVSFAESNVADVVHLKQNPNSIAAENRSFSEHGTYEDLEEDYGIGFGPTLRKRATSRHTTRHPTFAQEIHEKGTELTPARLLKAIAFVAAIEQDCIAKGKKISQERIENTIIKKKGYTTHQASYIFDQYYEHNNMKAVRITQGPPEFFIGQIPDENKGCLVQDIRNDSLKKIGIRPGTIVYKIENYFTEQLAYKSCRLIYYRLHYPATIVFKIQPDGETLETPRRSAAQFKLDMQREISAISNTIHSMDSNDLTALAQEMEQELNAADGGGRIRAETTGTLKTKPTNKEKLNRTRSKSLSIKNLFSWAFRSQKKTTGSNASEVKLKNPDPKDQVFE